MARGYRFGVVGSLSTVPDGSTVLPTDDIKIWLKCASIKGKTYTTLAQVLADSTTLQALISSNNAVDYMVRSTTWASGVTADSGAMTLIGANNYASNTLLGNSTWLNAICNSAYIESVLNVNVPAMTSNTTPSGLCEASASASGYAPYKAFDRDTTTFWATGGNLGAVAYTFTEEKTILAFSYKGYAVDNTANEVAILNGSNIEQFRTNLSNTSDKQVVILDNPITSTKFVLNILSMYMNQGASCVELQFYGREDV